MMNQQVLYQLCELVGRDRAKAGLHADAVEMNTAMFETLKKECATLSPRSYEYQFLAGLYDITIFIDDDMENGKIHIGMRKQFMEKRKYKDTITRLRAMLDLR